MCRGVGGWDDPRAEGARWCSHVFAMLGLLSDTRSNCAFVHVPSEFKRHDGAVWTFAGALVASLVLLDVGLLAVGPIRVYCSSVESRTCLYFVLIIF